MSAIQHGRIFYINSRDRTSGTDGNFSAIVQIPQTQAFDSVVVLDVLIPKSYYLVQTNQNTFTLQEGSQQATVTIPVGNYNRNNFQSVLQTQLRAASPNGWVHSVTYPNTTTNPDTGKYTYTVT